MLQYYFLEFRSNVRFYLKNKNVDIYHSAHDTFLE
jgi:hypothetical protein